MAIRKYSKAAQGVRTAYPRKTYTIDISAVNGSYPVGIGLMWHWGSWFKAYKVWMGNH